MRFVFVLALFLLTVGFAQSALEQMRENLQDGYYAVAAQVLGPQLVSDPSFQTNPEAHYLFAQALYLTGNFEGARSSLDKAIALSDEVTPQYRHLEGLLFAAEGISSLAIEALAAAFAESQDYTIAMDWGRIAWQLGRLDEALTAFDAAASTDKGQKELWPFLNKGRILKGQQRYPEAIEAFNQAIATFEATDVAGSVPSPAYVEAYYQLGSIYELLGDTRQAIVNYLNAKTVSPTYELAERALARLGAN